nr:MAG TPA: hypothetical protein [Caudoviricetes sp.]
MNICCYKHSLFHIYSSHNLLLIKLQYMLVFILTSLKTNSGIDL